MKLLSDGNKKKLHGVLAFSTGSNRDSINNFFLVCYQIVEHCLKFKLMNQTNRTHQSAAIKKPINSCLLLNRRNKTKKKQHNRISPPVSEEKLRQLRETNFSANHPPAHAIPIKTGQKKELNGVSLIGSCRENWKTFY